MKARKLSSFLSESDSVLSRLTAIAQNLQKLSRIWESIAPIHLARSSRVGRLEDGVLTLYADNGAIASKLKQQLPSLLTNFQQRGAKITGIRIDVQVNQTLNSPKKHQKSAISAQSLACVESLTGEIQDTDLKEALTNLIRHQKSST